MRRAHLSLGLLVHRGPQPDLALVAPGVHASTYIPRLLLLAGLATVNGSLHCRLVPKRRVTWSCVLAAARDRAPAFFSIDAEGGRLIAETAARDGGTTVAGEIPRERGERGD